MSEPIVAIPPRQEAGQDASGGAGAGVREVRGHIRGSTLLLVGRVISLATNFLVQLLTVRYLSKSDYGAFAWAWSIVSVGAILSLFGLNRAAGRYLPIYHERGDYPSMFGTIFLTFTSLLGIGTAMVVAAFGLRAVFLEPAVNDPLAVSLLLILIALAPLQALDNLCQGIVVVFARARAVFLRRHVLGPCLRLAAVLFVLGTRGDVHLLAWGYLVGGILGVLVYFGLLRRILGELGLARYLSFRAIRVPAWEIISFGLPLLTVDVVFILKASLAVVLLQHFGSTVDVASFRAVSPVATLNDVVLQSFKFLFIPVAARLLTRQDTAGVGHLYWHTTLWIALATFPVFAVTCLLAHPVTVLFFGERYADSGSVLAVLAFGEYFSAALGLNSQLLQVYGKVGFIVVASLFVVALSLGLNLWLIPRYGALGAAIGTAGALVAHNLVNQIGLSFAAGLRFFHWPHLRAYATIVAAALVLFTVQALVRPPLPASLALAAAASLALIRVNRRALDVEHTFPELLRLPLATALLGSTRG